MRQAISLLPLNGGHEPRPVAWAGMRQAFGLSRKAENRSPTRPGATSAERGECGGATARR